MNLEQSVRATTVARRREGIELEQLSDGSVLLMAPEKGVVYPLNSTGAVIWKLCDGVRSVAGMAAEIARAHPEAEGRAERDVSDFVRSLVDAELVDIRTSEAGGGRTIAAEK